MEGPTPVSSLIHAATMVTAGIYLILRLSYMFESLDSSSAIVLFIGSFTTLFAASIGLVQFDLKKVVAYSTCSQLGYMFLGCSFFGYTYVIFHLFIHAFFKALLFLTAGYLIHLLANEQDSRRMGGLLYLAQFSYITMGIGSFALIGFPFFSGFFSKEKIVEYTTLLVVSKTYSCTIDTINSLAILFSYSTLILTILYSFKIYSSIFYGKFNGFRVLLHNLSYSEFYIVIPLFVLSLLSIYTVFFFSDCMTGIASDYWGNSFKFSSSHLGAYVSNSYNSNLKSYLGLVNITFFKDSTSFLIPILSEAEWSSTQ